MICNLFNKDEKGLARLLDAHRPAAAHLLFLSSCCGAGSVSFPPRPVPSSVPSIPAPPPFSGPFYHLSFWLVSIYTNSTVSLNPCFPGVGGSLNAQHRRGLGPC